MGKGMGKGMEGGRGIVEREEGQGYKSN